MSIEMTLAFVRAAVQRAEHQGDKTVELNVLDMLELLPRVESYNHKERADKPMKRLGWVSPGSVKGMFSGKKGKRGARLLRFKTPENNMEVFYCDKLSEKIEESERLVSERDAKDAEKAEKAKEAVEEALRRMCE